MIPNLSKISSFACGPLFHFSHIYHISQENWILWKNESLSSTFSKDFPTMTYRATDFEKEKYRVLENESKKNIFLLCYVKANFVNHLVFLLAIKRIATNCIPSRKCFIYPFAWKKLFLTRKIKIFRIHSDSKITSIILCLDDIINNGNALHTFCSDSSLFLLTMLHNECKEAFVQKSLECRPSSVVGGRRRERDADGQSFNCNLARSTKHSILESFGRLWNAP